MFAYYNILIWLEESLTSPRNDLDLRHVDLEKEHFFFFFSETKNSIHCQKVFCMGCKRVNGIIFIDFFYCKMPTRDRWLKSLSNGCFLHSWKIGDLLSVRDKQPYVIRGNTITLSKIGGVKFHSGVYFGLIVMIWVSKIDCV